MDGFSPPTNALTAAPSLARRQHLYGFKVGLEANFALKILAETGDLSSLVVSRNNVSSSIQATM